MRHFRNKLNQSFFDELKSYIATYAHINYSDEHTECLFDALDAIDDYYDKSYSLIENDFAQTNELYAPAPACTKPFEQTGDLSDIAKILKKPSFADNLFKIIDEKGLKDSKVYKRADIDRRLFSKIRSNRTYHPSKETAIKLCLALELNIAEAERLLETAGYCLSKSSTSDLVIRYCIEHNEFNLINVNEALDYFSESAL